LINQAGDRQATICTTALLIFTATIFFLTSNPAPALEIPPIAARVDSLWDARERQAAASLLETELPLARAADDSALVSNLLVMKGAFANFHGNSREAETVLREGLALARARRDSTLLMSGVRWLSLAVGNQGRQDEAVELFRELLKLGIALGDRRHQGWAHIGMAWADWHNGEAEKALAGYEQAAMLFPGTGDVEGELWANNGIASVNNDLGRYDRAAAGYRATIEVATPEGVALNNLGTLEYSLGRSDVALGHFRRANDLHSDRGNTRLQLAFLFNISLCLNDLGQVKPAREALDEALAICDAKGYRDMRSRTLVKIASMELQRHRLHNAARMIQEAMNDPETMLVKDVIEARIELGEIFRKQGDFPAAASQFAQADSLLVDKTFTWVRMRLMGHQAQVFRSLGESQRALDQFLALAKLAAEKELPEFRLTALSEAAQTCVLLDRPDTALVLFDTAATTWENDRRLLLSPQWRERRGANGREIFPDLAILILETGDPAAAFNRLQSYKARTLLERMLGPGEAFASYLSRSDVVSAGLTDVQTSLLSEDELLLDFTLGPRVSLLFAVTRDTVVLRRLPPAAEIESRARAYFDLLKDPGAGSSATLTAVGTGLVEMLLPDLPRACRNKDRILVAPDGALNLLPFAELNIQERSQVWTRIPSASVLLELRRKNRGPRKETTWRTLAVASGWGRDSSPLPGTLREVRRLSRDYRQVKTRILFEQDTELPSFTGYDVLHLAAHASNDDQSPWQSAIHFLPDDQAGRLRAADILEMRLDAGLTVLSSCGSGAGKILSGEGVLGLSSAFLSAGVPAVLASLWAVDDGATVRFMDLYYGFLADGQDCAMALASTQQDMRSKPSTDHPYYWAGFVLIGDGALQPQMTRTRSWLTPFALALLVVSLLISMGVRRG